MSKSNSHLGKILDVSQNLFFNYGYDSVSMSNIAKSVNLTKAALYYHFESKEDLYLNILQKNLSDFRSSMGEILNSSQFKKNSLNKKIEQITVTYFDFVSSRNNILKLLVKRIDINNKKIMDFFSKARAETIRIFKALSDDIIKHNNNKIINHHDMTLFLFGMVTPFIHEGVHNHGKYSPKDIAKKVCSILVT